MLLDILIVCVPLATLREGRPYTTASEGSFSLPRCVCVPVQLPTTLSSRQPCCAAIAPAADASCTLLTRHHCSNNMPPCCRRALLLPRCPGAACISVAHADLQCCRCMAAQFVATAPSSSRHNLRSSWRLLFMARAPPCPPRSLPPPLVRFLALSRIVGILVVVVVISSCSFWLPLSPPLVTRITSPLSFCIDGKGKR